MKKILKGRDENVEYIDAKDKHESSDHEQHEHEMKATDILPSEFNEAPIQEDNNSQTLLMEQKE